MKAEIYKAIDRHRISRRMSIRAFADELGVEYIQLWNTFKRGTIPHEYNRQPYQDYYAKNRTEIDAIMTTADVDRDVDVAACR